MINYFKVKDLKIKPERIRELISQIEAQSLNTNALKSYQNEVKINPDASLKFIRLENNNKKVFNRYK